MDLTPDLLAPGGIADYAQALRQGVTSAASVTAAFLERIAEDNPALSAFTHIASEHALETACGIDQLVRGRVDLGPLMGVPIALKDLYAAAGMPLAAGSRLDVSDVAPREGSLVRRLKRGGAIVLGKTRTTEFAFGTYNLSHPTPWNPCDARTHRMPGGSSSGSAVALAAGLAPITFGSDTGGSVRLPAALCGIAGFKATAGALPMDGVFPLSHTLDSPGWFAASARDLAQVWQVLADTAVGAPRRVAGLRVGRPQSFFFDGLDAAVAHAMDASLAKLSAAGCRVIDVALPPASAMDAVFGAFLAAELVSFLGRERVTRELENMDPLVRGRILPGLGLTASEYIGIQRELSELARKAHAAIADLDVVVTPTCPLPPLPVQAFDTPERAAGWTREALRFTRPFNMFGMCAVSLPVGHLGSGLPVGLQLVAQGGRDTALLGIAMAVESVIGTAPRAPTGHRRAPDSGHD